MEQKLPITGTFIDEITYDIPSSNWSESEWKQELDYMKSFGIDTLVIIRGGFYDKMTYPSEAFHTQSSEDFAGLILNEAAKRNMKVFMGLYISNLDWNKGDASGEIKKNKKFISEVLQRYYDIPSFNGWYIPHETCCDRFNIIETMSGLTELCKEKSPDKQILISPFFKSEIVAPENPMSPEQYYEEWDRIFDKCGRNIDILACQDGTAPLGKMREYFGVTKRLCEKYNMHHWVNAETFERDVRQMYYPIPFNILHQRLDMHMEYAEKIITFEFSHFLSPQSIYPSARNLNKRYIDFYGCASK